jgi:hypothetical protein
MGTRKYNPRRSRDFLSAENVGQAFFEDFGSITVPLGFAFAGQPRRLSLHGHC